MKTKPFIIPKEQVFKAYKLVKANAGAAGVDKQSLSEFGENLEDNLYKIWNRMSSGSYFPSAVKEVPIEKKDGGERILGIPTVGDRIAQMVVKLQFEPLVEPHFLEDSYGYRAWKSALDAVEITRKRCWEQDWVLEFDIKGMFDNIPHDLLMKAVEKHTSCKWIRLYIERWLKAPMETADGNIVAREKGTPQGGVISPVLSNLFLHYTFDLWMSRNYPDTKWCRYADDGLVHCSTEEEAKEILTNLEKRFKECGLELHPTKTRIIYCKDDRRQDDYPTTSFDFLGYTFCARTVKYRNGTLRRGFNPAASNASLKEMRSRIKKSGIRHRNEMNLEEIAEKFNPILRGWLNYYGKYSRSTLYKVWRHFNKAIVAWIMKKYKKVNSKTKAINLLNRIYGNQPTLFEHWKHGMIGAFA
jgi:RNA-directed DNA polymerase